MEPRSKYCSCDMEFCICPEPPAWVVDSKVDRQQAYCHLCHGYELVWHATKGDAKTLVCSECIGKGRAKFPPRNNP